jgi:catalase (peroxidase I)
MGRRSLGYHRQGFGFMLSVDSTPRTLDNKYFEELLHNDWMGYLLPGTSNELYKADSMFSDGHTSYILRSDFLLTLEPSFRAAAQDFAADDDMFLEEFASAWTKIMNADRFDGPTGNLCEPFKTTEEMKKSACPMTDADPNTALMIGVIVFLILLACSLAWNVVSCFRSKSTEAHNSVNAKGTTVLEHTYDQGQQNSPRVGNWRV